MEQQHIMQALENKWYVLYVRSRAEKKVKQRLDKLKIESFLPLIKVVRQWSDRKKTMQVPLFPSYLFLHITPEDFTKIRMIEGVVGFVKNAGIPALMKENEIREIKLFLETGYPVEAASGVFLPGEKVRIHFGPLKNITGELIAIQNEKHFVIRIQVINQILKVSVPHNYLEKV